jgi:DNA repair protein RadC
MDNYIRFTLLNLNPSDADVLITKKIRPASEQLDINLLDHLILSPEEKYYSMADEGVIKFIEEI